MLQRYSFYSLKWTCFCLLGVLVFGSGLTCPLGGGPSPNPNPAGGNTPPRLMITNIVTDQGNFNAQQGDPVVIQFIGEDAEDVATVRVFASASGDPTPEQQIEIGSGFQVGPGFGGGSATWDTTSVAIGAFNIFGEISDGTFDPVTGLGNPPVRVTFANLLAITPKGSSPLTTPPELVFIEPRANLGLSTDDELTIRYVISDPDSNIKVTLMLDKDRIPTNDNVDNPGDPLNPATNIIILPSAPRLNTDPTFDGDPPPPDDPLNPPQAADSLEIRTNPREFPATAPGAVSQFDPQLEGEDKEYRFVIDFAQVPVRSQPYFIRATVSDGGNTVHQYAVGSLTISSLASGIVDTSSLGFALAGARMQGFSLGENLGTSILPCDDLDGDSVDDFMIAGRYAAPRNRISNPQLPGGPPPSGVGAGYLIFGRKKTPFPPDSNNNGLPDVITPSGPVDYPVPPVFLPNPYDASNIGRFGGILSVNSIASFFRGTTYGMPRPRFEDLLDEVVVVPPSLADAGHPAAMSAGLTSITRIDMTGDGIRDFFFGLPYVGGAYDYADNDPGDGDCDNDLVDDTFPGGFCTATQGNDDIGANLGGMVIMVDGTNDIEFRFRQFIDAGMAGQYDPGPPPQVTDDEGFLLSPINTPQGARLRGAWFGTDNEYEVDNEYGRTIAAMPSFDNDTGDDLIISAPGADFEFPEFLPNPPPIPEKLDCGMIQVWHTGNFLLDGYTNDGVRSFPKYDLSGCAGNSCVGEKPTGCCRSLGVRPGSIEILGARTGDLFGYAGPAGQFNQDGTEDILAGAPGADRNNLSDNGIFYVLFTPAGGFGNTDLALSNPPRLEVIGSHSNDQFGRVQIGVQDMDGDTIDDVAFSSHFYDDNTIGADAGYVGVIFGKRPITGEGGFAPEQVGTSNLFGCKFIGTVAGAKAGFSIGSAGDFNSDGYGDLLITSPGESRVIGGQNRLGVAYLIFGGNHLTNKTFNLSQVGVANGQGQVALPGIVFVSRFQQGTVDEAPLETCGGVGDVDGDGFDDIILGAPHADFVNLASPNQRRPDAGEVYLIYGNNFGSNDLGP